MDKKELLEELQKYNVFIVQKIAEINNCKKKGVVQSTVYHNVKLCWNGSAFKLWNNKDKDVDLFFNSNIEKYEWNDDIVVIHIVDCPELITMSCYYSNNC